MRNTHLELVDERGHRAKQVVRLDQLVVLSVEQAGGAVGVLHGVEQLSHLAHPAPRQRQERLRRVQERERAQELAHVNVADAMAATAAEC